MANLFRCAGAGGEDIKCIERPYNSNDMYNTGDTAMYNGLLRICLADGVTGEFDESKWEVTTLDELLGESAGENDVLVDYIASEYDPTHTYATGDAILGDNGEILKCLEDDITGEFDNSKWSRDYLCNLSGNVNSNLTPNMVEKIMSLMEIVKLPYTATEEGYVTVTVTYSLSGWASGMYVSAGIYLNGELIASARGQKGAKADITQKVVAGDKITVSGNYTNNSGQSDPTMSGTATCYFIPLD